MEHLKNMSTEAQSSKEKADCIIEWLRDFANRRVNSLLMDERRMVSPHIVLEFGNHGLFGMLAPTQYGGLGLKLVDVYRVVQQVAAIDTTLGAMLGIHNALVVNNLVINGTEEQKLQFLPQLTSGRQLGSFAVTEEGLSNNYKLLSTKAVKQTDGSWLLYGSKIWIGLSSWSGVLIVLANEIDEQGHGKGISCFVVSSDTAGIRFGDESLTMGVKAIIQNAIHFDAVRIEANGLLGNSGFGLEVAKTSFKVGRIGISMISLGVMKRVSQLMYRYAERRSLSSSTLLENTNFRSHLYWNLQAAKALEVFVKFVGNQIDENNYLHDDACNLLKIICPELAYKTVDNGMQMIGARGYIETNYIPQLMRDVRLLRIFEGSTEALGDSLGRSYIRHSSNVEQHLLVEKLNAIDLLNELEVLKSEIIIIIGDADDSKIYIQYAELVGYACVFAVNRMIDEGIKNIGLDWAEKAYKKNYATLKKQLDNFELQPDPSVLKSLVDSLVQEIGDVYQQATDEERYFDNYLVPDEYRNKVLDATISSLETENQETLRFVENETTVQKWLVEQLSIMLKTESSISPDASIYDLHLDSINAVELMIQIGSRYEVDLDEKFLFGNFSIADITFEIVRQINEKSQG
jgi:alkylation response protein AidB-like acyl-CoA dehydrogenase/acyl carrier protein